MKLDYAIVGSNNDPMYLDFWPIISKVWKTVFNITPVLGLITDGDEEIINDEFGIIFKLNQIDGYSDGLLSQLVRMYLPKYLNGNCIISDIDMIPLSKKYFIEDLKKYNDDDFIIMSSHHPQTIGSNQYPMCYVAGNDKIFKEIFSLNDKWEDFLKKIPDNGWYTDQLHLYNVVNSNKRVSFKFPQRSGDFTNDRVDRSNWGYDLNKLNDNYYVDCHSLRPYSVYKEEIDKLTNLI